MRIAIVTPDDLSTLIFCKPFALRLAGHPSVTVYSVSSVDLYRAEITALPTIHVEIPMARFLSLAEDWSYFWRLRQIFAENRIDVAILFTTKPNIYGALAARAAGVKTVAIAVRGLGSAFLADSRPKVRLLKAITTTLYRAACTAANWVWFTNRNDREYFISRKIVPQPKTFLTSNAVNLTDFSVESVAPKAVAALRQELAMAEDDRAVIMVARLIWPKGIREFAEAARLLRERLPNLTFLLVAPEEKGSPNSVPPDYVREMERVANFRWLGFRKDVRELYALAGLAVLPSYYKEGGYPRALLEPMALGKPVIAADTEDCRAPVEDGVNGYVIPPKDAAALADRIARIMEDDELRKSFGQQSLAIVRARFDDRVVAEEVLERLGIRGAVDAAAEDPTASGPTVHAANAAYPMGPGHRP